MLQELVWETYRKASPAEVQAFYDEAKRMVETYGWQNRTVMPWTGCELSIKTILADVYALYNEPMTEGSKVEIVALANGLAEIMNAWEEHEHEPKLLVRSVKNGKVHALSREFALELVKDGLVVLA